MVKCVYITENGQCVPVKSITVEKVVPFKYAMIIFTIIIAT